MRAVAVKYPNFIAVPIEHLPLDKVLPYSLHIRIDEKLIAFRKVSDVLTSERTSSLGQKGVQYLYVPKAEWNQYVQSLEQDLSFLEDESMSEESAALSAKSLLFAYVRAMEEGEAASENSLQKLEQMTKRLSKAISKEIALAGKLLRRYNDPALYFANHALNTCIFSTAIGIKYGLKGADLQELAFAACVANIGLMKVPRELLLKPSEPTSEEWKLLRQHPVDGETVLRLCLVSPRVCEAVGQHHERYDGSGYPKGLKGNQISLFARIIAIAEQFSAKTSVRPWAPALPADKAISEIKAEAGRFDPQLLNMSLNR